MKTSTAVLVVAQTLLAVASAASVARAPQDRHVPEEQAVSHDTRAPQDTKEPGNLEPNPEDPTKREIQVQLGSGKKNIALNF